MQTFLPYPDFKKSASCLDNKRLGKQRVEAWQIYSTLQKIKERFNLNSPNCTKPYGDDCGYCSDCKDFQSTIKIPWENHPAVKIWAGYEEALLVYGIVICEEWIKRGYKDNIKKKFTEELHKREYVTYFLDSPELITSKEFNDSHKSNLLRKNPEHYNQFKRDVPDNLPYVWSLDEVDEK